MNFGGRLFAGRLFAGQLFGRRQAQAAVFSGSSNWLVDEQPAQKRRPRRAQIQANNTMLIAALLAVVQGEQDGSLT